MKEWVKYIAKDESGNVWGFSEKPERFGSVWLPVDDAMKMVKIRKENPKGWENSVEKINKK